MARQEVARSIYEHHDHDLAVAFVDQLGHDLQDQDHPPEVRSLGRTPVRWRDESAAWRPSHVSNGPTEAVNNLVKRVKHTAFGITNWRNCRIRALLYAGKPNWKLLPPSNPAETRSATLVSSGCEFFLANAAPAYYVLPQTTA